MSELPVGAVTACSSDRCENQAFRVGPAAWGVQFHLEALAATARAWAGEGVELRAAGVDPEALVRGVQAAEPQLRRWWSEVGDRWLDVVRGTVPHEA